MQYKCTRAKADILLSQNNKDGVNDEQWYFLLGTNQIVNVDHGWQGEWDVYYMDENAMEHNLRSEVNGGYSQIVHITPRGAEYLRALGCEIDGNQPITKIPEG